MAKLCRKNHPSDFGKVYYLTIQETMVKAGTSQRRPGLHVDSPGRVRFKRENKTKKTQKYTSEGAGSSDKFECKLLHK